MRNINSLIVSPHPDDAALSLSTTIDSLAKKTLITTFDFSKEEIGGVVDTGIRQNEERHFAKTVDAKVIFLNEQDSNYRGEYWDKFDYTIRVSDLDRITSKYLKILESFNMPFNLFVPMAFGLHPDHVMSFYCCLCLFSKIASTEIDIYFYHDLPYFLGADAKMASQKTIINTTNLIQIQTVHKEKEKLLKLYKSQLSDKYLKAFLEKSTTEYLRSCSGSQLLTLDLCKIDSLARMDGISLI